MTIPIAGSAPPKMPITSIRYCGILANNSLAKLEPIFQVANSFWNHRAQKAIEEGNEKAFHFNSIIGPQRLQGVRHLRCP
jgi:mannose/fructose/N-acetylgalactosamine-specific phosphotransferase system component IIC